MPEHLARKMVRYHIEGEHVFPEPECPSCRLDEALRRAAEKVAGYRENLRTLRLADYLAGWLAAIQFLRDEGHDCPGECDEEWDGCRVIASFIRAMLGGDDA